MEERVTKLKILKLAENQGHGNARRQGLWNCTHELVALMDADDISVPGRFERQLEMFQRSPEICAAGGQILEFTGSPDEVVGMRKVPRRDAEIKAYLKRRCPFNQMTVMLRKEAAEQAGGYLDWYCDEDYYLWIRMLQQNAVFANSGESLVYARAGNEMYGRRGGWRYFQSEARLQNYMRSAGILNGITFIENICLRFVLQLLLPNGIRSRIYRFLREKNIEKAGIPGKAGFETPPEPRPQEPEKKYPPFSVLMCVYGGDHPEYFDMAFASIVEQTVKPSEIVLVVDGPVPEATEKVIEKYKSILGSNLEGGGVKLSQVRLKENSGLGIARRAGLAACTHELVALMDADDISCPRRFEKQLARLGLEPEVSVIGSNIAEFVKTPAQITGMRCVPEQDSEIKEFLKTRCPFNHQTVLFKKSDVQKAGGYVDWYYDEDYYLWIRMFQAGMKFANVPEVLLLFRGGKEMYKRRGGWSYFQSERKLQDYMRDAGIISRRLHVWNVAKRFAVQVLMTNGMRELAYRVFAREKR